MHPSRPRTLLPATALALCIAAPAGPSTRAGDLSREEVPDIALPDLDGHELPVTAPEGGALVLLFGEVYNRNSIAALDELVTTLEREPLAKAPVRVLFVTGARDTIEELRKAWGELGKDARVPVVHDRRRELFEALGIKVLPTLVVAGRDRRLAVKVSGYPLNFRDIVTDGIQFALGRIERDALDRALDPEAPAGPGATRARAIRTCRMAEALARRKLLDLAAERFEEAASLDPSLPAARLGLAGVRLEQGRVQEAEALYREALELAPSSVAAHAGLARIEIQRDQLDRAERRLKEQVRLHPLHAELHFLLGALHEKKGATGEALSAYKKAAALLLERSGAR